MMTTPKKKSEEPKKVKVSELYSVREGIRNVGEFSKPAKFRYGIAKNGRKINAEIEDIESPTNQPEKLKDYQKERAELESELGAMDGDKLMRKEPTDLQKANNQPGDIIWKDPEKAEKAFRALKKKYKEDIDKYDEGIRDLNKHIKEGEIEFEYHMISQEELPDDLPARDLELLWPILIDEGEPED